MSSDGKWLTSFFIIHSLKFIIDHIRKDICVPTEQTGIRDKIMWGRDFSYIMHVAIGGLG